MHISAASSGRLNKERCKQLAGDELQLVIAVQSLLLHIALQAIASTHL